MFAGSMGSDETMGCPLTEGAIGANMMPVVIVNSEFVILAAFCRSSCSSVTGSLVCLTRAPRGVLSAAPIVSSVPPETKDLMEGTRSPNGCPGGRELRSGSEDSFLNLARYRALITAAAEEDGGEEELARTELEASSPKSGTSGCRGARLCWLYNRLHLHHQIAAIAAKTTATLASAITTKPQIGISVLGDAWLTSTLSPVGTGLVVVVLVVLVLVVLVLVLVLELELELVLVA